MSVEANASVEEAIPEPVAQAAETENVQERSESATEKRKRNDAEYNWAEMRRKMQERDHQIDALQSQLSKLQPRAETPVPDELDGLAQDDLLTVKQAKGLAAREARKIAEEIVKQREASTVEERLSLKFNDYAEVVSKENIEFLKETEPELAISLYHNPDPYAQGVAAYKLLKKIGMKQDKSNPEKDKAIQNSQKPVSVQAVTKQSAIGNAHLFENGLTKELKASLLKEMQDAAKRY